MEQHNITKEEIELIAALNGQPAFDLLLSSIQATIDDVGDALYLSQKKDQDEYLLPYWRALRSIFMQLKTRPQLFAEQLAEAREKMGQQVEEHQINEYQKVVESMFYQNQPATQQMHLFGGTKKIN